MIRVIAFLALFTSFFIASAKAQTLLSSKELEEAEIRRELEEIISKDAIAAPDARTALDALNRAETSPQGRQVRNRRERGVRRIVNGVPVRAYPAVGALLKGGDAHVARAWCTGTLVGCNKFLTAAHCIAENPTPKDYLVYFQELGFFGVQDIKWEPSKYRFPYFDIAMLTLKTSVEGIAPAAINTTVKPLNNSVATIVGFGRTGGTHYDYGIKREGSVRTTRCPSSYDGLSVLCWRFDAEIKSNRSASNTCNADSGGGVFMRDNEGLRIVEKVFGVVSGGRDRDCLKNDLSYNVDVFQYREWIAIAGEGKLSSEMCGSPLSEGREFEPKQAVIHVDSKTPQGKIKWSVPQGATALRAAMNGEDDGEGANAFELSVFRDDRSAVSGPRCNGDGPGPFAFCEVTNPGFGEWIVSVVRSRGEGDVQVTATFVGR